MDTNFGVKVTLCFCEQSTASRMPQTTDLWECGYTSRKKQVKGGLQFSKDDLIVGQGFEITSQNSKQCVL